MNKEQLIATGISEEQADAILGLHNEDVNGLKSKNTELLGKFDSFKTDLSAKDQALEDARQVAAKAEEEKLKANGDMEGLKAHYEEQLANTTAQMKLQTETAQNALKQRDLSEVHSDIMRGVHENFTPAAQALLAANTEVTYGDDGAKKVTIRHGDKEFNSTADFKEFAKTDPTWSAMLKAPDTKGIGATNTGGQAASGKDSAFEQRLRDSGLIN